MKNKNEKKKNKKIRFTLTKFSFMNHEFVFMFYPNGSFVNDRPKSLSSHDCFSCISPRVFKFVAAKRFIVHYVFGALFFYFPLYPVTKIV